MTRSTDYKDKVSVVIPTYNRAHLIVQSIRSVLNQDYPNLEVIVVDDASTDNTEDVVRKLDDKRVKYISHEKNKGANAARNTGLKNASGIYIAFQDSDDEWMPEKLSKQMKIFEESDDDNLGIVYTAFWKIQDESKTYIPSKDVTKTNGNLHDVLLTNNFISTQTLLLKKDCFAKVGMFDNSLPRLQDWEMLLRLSKEYKFCLVDEPLVNVYHTEGSISTNQKKLADTLTLILEKHYDDFAKNKKVLASYYCYMSQQFFLLGERYKTYHYCLKALKLNGTKIKFWFILMSFLLGKAQYKKIKNIFIYISQNISPSRKIDK